MFHSFTMNAPVPWANASAGLIVEDTFGGLSDMDFWYRADSLVTTSGTDVLTWGDKQENLGDLEPIEGFGSPTLISSSSDWNNQATIFTDNTFTEGLRLPSGGADDSGGFTSTATGRTSFLVTRDSVAIGARQLVSHNNTIMWAPFKFSNTDWRFQGREGFINIVGNPNRDSTTANIWTIHVDRTLGSLEHKMYEGSTLFKSTSWAGATFGISSKTLVLPSGSTEYTEYVGFDRALTSQELTDVWDYLSERYGITL